MEPIIRKRSVQSDLDIYIGGRVKSRRTLLGISQEKLGKHLGITFQQVQKYEKGINRISASSLYSIADVLSVNWSYFVDGYDNASMLSEENGLVYETDSEKKGDVVDLLYFFGKITDVKLRKKVIEIVKAMAVVE
ncbi:MAG: helix-turn-helix domain-containing protein [Holosporaceae bacterium]|jgi:transcriptional regulator with XRE-family HTH domain|nr:helix-turn-helix domain-containing protein [Holosporaceae bacterium]